MSEPTQPELTLETVAEFHQQLLNLHQAGLRLQLDHGKSTRGNFSQELNNIMAYLVSQVGKFKSLEECIQQSDRLPERYRIALLTWCKCDRTVEALSILRAQVQQEVEGAVDLRFALLLPLIILALVYGASFYLLLVTVPRMEAVYLQVNEIPSLPVRWLLAVRWAMPYWVPGLPLLIALIAWLLFTGRVTLPKWLPGRKQLFQYSSASQLARNLATQVDRDSNSASSLALFANRSGKDWRGLMQAPMLRWALATEAPPVGQPEDTAAIAQHHSRRLRLAASLYETMHAIHAQQFRSWLILFCCVVLGGGVTLIYVLALFVPLVELLKDMVR